VVGAWVVVFGLAWGLVGLPERCPPATAATARAAAEDAVDWFGRNQRTDGHFVYQYDREDDVVDRADHVVRQAGVTMSLYQADAAGIDGALELADGGTDWLLDNAVPTGDGAAIERGGLAPTGGAALLLAGLAMRRGATGDDLYDDQMRELGTFLVTMTEPSGAVLANWDVGADGPVPDDYSTYFTGEAYFALASLASVDDTGSWAETAARIAGYLPGRDDAEDVFPPVPDHWAAYGLAGEAVDLDRSLTDDEDEYARRLAGLFGVEVRFESQRTGEGVLWLLRGPQVMGSGLGTIGEGLGSLWRMAGDAPSLAPHEGTLSERTRCVAGMLVDRQVDAAEAATTAEPDRTEGAWFSVDGVTRMDDQQHSLSALLLAEPALAAAGPAGGGAGSSDDPSAARVLWLALVAVAAVNPLRVRRLAGPMPAHRAVPGLVVAAAIVALIALVGGPLLRAIELSPATALIAAGVMVALVGVIDAVRRWGAAGFDGDRADDREDGDDEDGDDRGGGGLGPTDPPGAAATADGTAGGGVTAAVDRDAAASPRDGRERVVRLLIPLVMPALVRPSVALLALAVAAETGAAAATAVVAAVALSGAAVLLPDGRDSGRRVDLLGTTLRWALAAVAVLGGIDLAYHGVFAV
jgi:hypothetical protein